ncbi:MAG TPA: hypothetical protein VG276_06155 [Actinomycetes bacterium]|nr:hypothetical protein [Actinomycetes bacterium]
MQSDDDAELCARVEAELFAQGLDVPIRDPTVLAGIAARLGAVDEQQRSRRLAALQRELSEMELTIPLLEPEEL